MKAQSTDCQAERIDAFLEGKLSGIQLAEFEKHLDVCSDCDAASTRRTVNAPHLFRFQNGRTMPRPAPRPKCQTIRI
jgi:predicted anti-sigma-YlaC factor YlaD